MQKFGIQFGNLGYNLEIWRKFGNFENIWKFEKNRNLETKIWKFKFFFGNLEKNWKLGKHLEIWKKFGNLKKIWKFGKKN